MPRRRGPARSQWRRRSTVDRSAGSRSRRPAPSRRRRGSRTTGSLDRPRCRMAATRRTRPRRASCTPGSRLGGQSRAPGRSPGTRPCPRNPRRASGFANKAGKQARPPQARRSLVGSRRASKPRPAPQSTPRPFGAADHHPKVTPQYTPHALMMIEAATRPIASLLLAPIQAIPSVTRMSANGAKSLLKR